MVGMLNNSVLVENLTGMKLSKENIHYGKVYQNHTGKQFELFWLIFRMRWGHLVLVHIVSIRFFCSIVSILIFFEQTCFILMSLTTYKRHHFLSNSTLLLITFYVSCNVLHIQYFTTFYFEKRLEWKLTYAFLEYRFWGGLMNHFVSVMEGIFFGYSYALPRFLFQFIERLLLSEFPWLCKFNCQNHSSFSCLK